MGGVVLCLVIPVVWGAARNRSLDMVPVGRVAVFQPNVTRELRATTGGADSTLARLAVLVREVSSEEFDLAVWPEATFTRDPRQDSALSAAISELVDALGSPVLFGAYLRGPVEDGRSVEYNGALLWRPGQGDAEFEYRKHRLVPGVEAVPLMDPGRLWGTTRVRGFGRGPGVQTQELGDGLSFSPLICFESTFSSDTRRAVRQGAGLLVSLTNDAWFGERPDAHPTVGMRHHAAHSVIRAVETRTGLARAANTGISMFVDPLGRTTGRVRPFSMAVHVESVYGTGRQTLFVRFGDLLGAGSAVVVLLTIVLSGIVQSKRDRPTH
jgi:apolipoprotein N-acyltransferase